MTICLISSFRSDQAGDGIKQPNLFFPHDIHGQQGTIDGSRIIEFITQLLIKHFSNMSRGTYTFKIQQVRGTFGGGVRPQKQFMN
jgi:hypothetical protein